MIHKVIAFGLIGLLFAACCAFAAVRYHRDQEVFYAKYPYMRPTPQERRDNRNGLLKFTAAFLGIPIVAAALVVLLTWWAFS